MTRQEIISKYKPYKTYLAIALKAYDAGLKKGREEKKTDREKKLEKKVKELQEYHDNMEKTLYDPEEFAKLIGGL